mmetsp:Transcript_1115/g.2008  ORF Transcript_1115/g.2008 Transcript_1115/m.2008 type:complete len:320 (-) Transcript_1115:2521-3480(-)
MIEITTSLLISFGTCASAILYLLLTFTAIISIFSPCLSRLAAHGKTRTSIMMLNPLNGESTSPSSIFSKWKVFLLEHPCLQINKEHFTTFYSIGLIWSGIIILLTSNVVPQTAVIFLLYLHLSRRYLECRFVHVWNGTMHLSGYILGLIHYILLPFVFVSNSHIRQNEFSTTRVAMGIALNVVAQYYQFVHHCILASYRKKSKKEKQMAIYSIPSGRWFQYISCPHYLAEILIYLSFAILLHPVIMAEKTDDMQMDGNMINHDDVTNHICCKVRPWRHMILVCWVFVNLAISARTSHAWYQKTFPSYPKHKKALLPWMW